MKTKLDEICLDVDGVKKSAYTNLMAKDYSTDPKPLHLLTCSHCKSLFAGALSRTNCKECQSYFDAHNARKS